VRLTGINDDFTGKAPDLGQYELGKATAAATARDSAHPELTRKTESTRRTEERIGRTEKEFSVSRYSE
jgi:hypothetical protein